MIKQRDFTQNIQETHTKKFLSVVTRRKKKNKSQRINKTQFEGPPEIERNLNIICDDKIKSFQAVKDVKF